TTSDGPAASTVSSAAPHGPCLSAAPQRPSRTSGRGRGDEPGRGLHDPRGEVRGARERDAESPHRGRPREGLGDGAGAAPPVLPEGVLALAHPPPAAGGGPGRRELGRAG